MKKTLLIPLLYSIFQLFSLNSSAQWQQTNGPYGGNVNCIAINGSNIFIGTTIGVYLSTNNGNSWSAVNTGLTNTSVLSLAISGSNIFAGTEGGGVFLSSNNGNNWSAVNTGLTNTTVWSLAISGSNIFAGTIGGGVFLSTNNGSSWTATNTGITDPYIETIAFSGASIFAGTQNGVFLSTNNGSSWTPVNTGLIGYALSVSALAINGSNIFAGTPYGVYLSTNNGDNWTAASEGIYNVDSFVTSGSNIFAGTSNGVYLSTNNGGSWTAVRTGLINSDVSALAISGSNIFAGTEFKGVFLSSNNGDSWTAVNTGFINSYVPALAISGGNIFASNYDIGVFLSSNNGYSWAAVNTGLTNPLVAAFAISGSNIFAGTEGGGVFLSTNNGSSWTPVNTGLIGGALSVLSLAISGSNIFAGTLNGMFISINNGSSWTPVNTGITDSFIRTIAISESYIFAGTQNGVFISINNGSSWTPVNTGLIGDALSVYAIAISGSNIFAGTQNGMFLSINNGSSWTPVNTGITDSFIRTIAISESYIFAGTQNGVFISINNGSSWAPVNTGLIGDALSVYAIAISGSNIFAGALGAGVWKRPLSEMISSQIVYVSPNISISTAQVKTGQTITFSGKQFSPVGKVDLSFSGPGTINPVQDYGIDILGNFQYIFTVASSLKSGTYILTAIDKVTGKSSSRTFQIVESNAIDDYLKIVEPNIACIRLIGDPVVIAWVDKITFNINPLYNYKHSYIVEYQLDNGTWQFIANIVGNNPGYGILNLSTTYSPTVTGVYKFRVTDNYYPDRSAATPEITVTSSTNLDVKIEFLWDKRFLPTSNVNSPVGVAADGVARFYMVASIINPSISRIQKVKVSLSDPESYESTQYLGKVKYCITQNDNNFTKEANDANSIIAENTSTNMDGKYWFWYVAPDDFARNEGDWGIGERIITVAFNITLLNGNSISARRDIKIARPPLMLVHGLNGDPDGTWGYFQVGSNNPLYYKDSRFKIKKAVSMEPNSHFNVNSNRLLSENENGNSFISLINEMKNAGYACCQVDYVCHSMGGSILRNAVENSNSYIRNNTYGKGYVNKFISLNTPHQGSSFANVLNDVGNAWILAGPIFSLGALNELYEIKPLSVKVVDAVEDLKFENGIKFNITDVPSHLIGSGVSCYSFNPKTAIIYELLKTYISAFLPGTGLLDHCSWYQIYFDLFGYESDFMDGSDAVVSLTSQFSGYNANSLPSFCSRIYGPMHNSTFGVSPTKSPAVWDRVNELLNKNKNSTLFYSMPATKVSGKNLVQNVPQKLLQIVEDRIKILYPAANAIYNVGDSITIKVQVDTAGLKSFALFFQDQSFFDIPATPNIEYRLIVSPEYIENQPIMIQGNYFISDTASISSANIDIKVNPVGAILDLNVQPEVMIIEKNKTRRPDYEAIFSDAIAQIGQTDLITVSIKDPDLVNYNSTTNEFTGLETGSTMATVSYRGKSKAVFFEIIQYEEAPVDLVTGIDEIESNKMDRLNVTVYPNPTNGIFTIATKEKDYELSVINILGEIILSQKGQTEKSEIDLSSQPSGIYFLHFYSLNGSTTKKIIIRK